MRFTEEQIGQFREAGYQEAQGGFARRPYLTGDQATGGRQEYGVEVAGTWDQEVARLLAVG